MTGGVDFGTDADLCRRLVAAVRNACSLPILAKLTPNVTTIADIAAGAAEGGADAVSLINTVLNSWPKKLVQNDNLMIEQDIFRMENYLGLASAGDSSCTPPESVMMKYDRSMSQTKSG